MTDEEERLKAEKLAAAKKRVSSPFLQRSRRMFCLGYIIHSTDHAQPNRTPH